MLSLLKNRIQPLGGIFSLVIDFRIIFEYLAWAEKMSRGRAVAARRAHNPEVGGSNPSPATKVSMVVLKIVLSPLNVEV